VLKNVVLSSDTFTRRDVTRQICANLPHGAPRQRVDALVAATLALPSVCRAPWGHFDKPPSLDDDHYTTVATIDARQRLMIAVAARPDVHVVELAGGTDYDFLDGLRRTTEASQDTIVALASDASRARTIESLTGITSAPLAACGTVPDARIGVLIADGFSTERLHAALELLRTVPQLWIVGEHRAPAPFAELATTGHHRVAGWAEMCRQALRPGSGRPSCIPNDGLRIDVPSGTLTVHVSLDRARRSVVEHGRELAARDVGAVVIAPAHELEHLASAGLPTLSPPDARRAGRSPRLVLGWGTGIAGVTTHRHLVCGTLAPALSSPPWLTLPLGAAPLPLGERLLWRDTASYVLAYRTRWQIADDRVLDARPRSYEQRLERRAVLERVAVVRRSRGLPGLAAEPDRALGR
jgi:hypothetical protein